LKKYHSLFKFKQFDIYQDDAAMKVGTDGVLLGAWSEFKSAEKILDVGTGTGLIALMAAQKKNKIAQIYAVEIDSEAAQQAAYNFKISPWKNRLDITQQDFKTYNPEFLFDVIVSNPPYFEEQFFSDNKKRNTARHTVNLNLTDLLQKSKSLLKPNGSIFLILPYNNKKNLLQTAKNLDLFPTKITYVKGNKETKIKRILVQLQPFFKPLKVDELIIEVDRHKYTQKYIDLTKDFYLKM